MFDGTDVVNDIDVRRQNLPLTIGFHNITNRNPSTPSPRPTAVSKSRSISSEIKKESTPATLKDIETLKLSHRHLETKLHELESRVQYVNPWAVQHMWEILMKLQERVFAGTHDDVVGAHHHSSSFPAAIFTSPQQQQPHHSRRSQRQHHQDDGVSSSLEANPMSPREMDAYRSCSPLTPNTAASAFDVSMLMPSEMATTGGGPMGSSALFASYLQGKMLEEWMARQHYIVEESLQRNRLMVALATSAATVVSQRGAPDVWASPVTKNERGATLMSPTTRSGAGSSNAAASGSLFRIDNDDDDNDVLLSSNSATFGRTSHRRSAPPPPPRLRSKFVEALITDKGFDERIKSMLADFVHPIVESSQKRFVAEAERWMQIHTGNIHHEFHEQMKTLTSEKDAATALIHDRIDAATAKINNVVTEAQAIVSDSVVTVNRLREDVVESSSAITLKLQRLDAFQQEMTRQVNIALDSRLSSLRASLERIGDHQDLLHRRLDDLHTRQYAPGGGASIEADDEQQEFKHRAAGDGLLMEQAVAYLDGMMLAPSSVAPHDDDSTQWDTDADGGVAQGHVHQQAVPTHHNNRLSDSVLLHDLHNALHRMWSLVTHRGNSYHGSSSGTASTTALAVGIKDLILRPVSLFPMHLVTSVVSTFLLRHNNYSLRSECIRMKLPAHVARGLEVGWQWLLSLSIGVLLRKSMTLFPADDDPLHMATELDEDYANDMVLDAYGIPQQTVAQLKGSSSLLHGGRLRSADAAALSRSESRSRSPIAVPHVAQMHQHHHHQPAVSSQRPQASSLDRNSHHTHQHNKPSLEMLASGAADTLIDGDMRQRGDHHISRSQRDSSDAHVMMHGGGTSFYTSIGGPMSARGAALAESIDHSSFYGAGRAASRAGTMSGLVSSTARSHRQVHYDSNSVHSSSRGSSRAPSPTVRKKLAFR